MNNHTPQEQPFDFGTADPDNDPRDRYAMRMTHQMPDPFHRQAFRELHDASYDRMRAQTGPGSTTAEFLQAFDEWSAASDALWDEFAIVSMYGTHTPGTWATCARCGASIRWNENGGWMAPHAPDGAINRCANIGTLHFTTNDVAR